MFENFVTIGEDLEELLLIVNLMEKRISNTEDFLKKLEMSIPTEPKNDYPEQKIIFMKKLPFAGFHGNPCCMLIRAYSDGDLVKVVIRHHYGTTALGMLPEKINTVVYDLLKNGFAGFRLANLSFEYRYGDDIEWRIPVNIDWDAIRTIEKANSSFIEKIEKFISQSRSGLTVSNPLAGETPVIVSCP